MEFKPRFPLSIRQILRVILFLTTFTPITIFITMHPGDSQASDDQGNHLDHNLVRVLQNAGFTGTIEAKFKHKLWRPIDQKRAVSG